MVMKALRHYALVSEMIGVEGIVTAEATLMIVNLQSLGVSVALTALPIIASALTSLVLIPLLGFITVRCAKTARQKALSLIAVNAWQFIGTALVVIANILRLMEDTFLNQASANTTDTSLDVMTFHTGLDLPDSVSAINNSNLANNAIISSHFETPTTNLSSLHYLPSNLSTSSRSLEDFTEADPLSSAGFGGLKLYAILAIIGYAMSDSGYDTGSCFLKTFALSCTPQRDHPVIIVRAIQMSSFGGIIVTLLVALGVGEDLARGTGWEVNSVTTIFIMAIPVIILLPTSVFTLTTGLCCTDSLYVQDWDKSWEDVENNESLKYEATHDEKQSLISDSFASTTSTDFEDKVQQWQVSFSSTKNNDDIRYHACDIPTRLRPTSAGTRSRHSSVSRDVMERIFQLSQSGAHSVMEEELSNVTFKHRGMENGRGFVELSDDQVVVDKGCFGTVWRFFKQQKKRLILCIGSFFALGALFAFNMYSVNFVTMSICGGDANAPPGSEKYENYLHGIKVGSTGLLVFYSSFVIGTTLQDILLRKLGWWAETCVMFVLYIVVNIVCAITKLEWVYYLCAFTNGIHRALVFTVPYILVCRLLTNNEDTDKGKGDNSKSESNGDIALVAAMLPLSMVMCAAVIGPIIELTGDAATPIYFSGVSAFIGFGMFFLLRKY